MGHGDCFVSLWLAMTNSGVVWFGNDSLLYLQQMTWKKDTVTED
jgi:hypothetical protein